MVDRGNIARWLREFEQEHGEPLLAVVVGKHYRAAWGDAPKEDENVLLSRDAALTKLDVDYDNGYGGADCFPMYAWTENFVLFIHEYDGATELAWIPRNPVACEPEFN